MRFLLLITQLELAGAQKAIFELGRGLAQQGHAVVVVACYDKAAYLPHFAEQYGVEVVSLAMKGSTPECWPQRVWRCVVGAIWLFALLRARRIQVLQSYTHYSNWLGPVVGWLAGVPHRVTSQRGTLELLPHWALWLDRCINNSWLVERMIAVSHATLAECVANGIRPDKLLVIHNGVDFAAYLPSLAPDLGADLVTDATHSLRSQLRLAPTDLIVLTVARLHPQKGYFTLLQAAQQVVVHSPYVKFVWVGEGELTPVLTQKCADLGLTNHVLLVGAQEQVQPYYQLADLFVLASYWEGLPNVLLEAASAGLPIVATRVGGVAEIIPDNGGYLVAPYCPDSLAQAILALLDEPARCEQMRGHTTRHLHQSFAQATNLQAYLHLYHELMADG